MTSKCDLTEIPAGGATTAEQRVQEVAKIAEYKPTEPTEPFVFDNDIEIDER